jgi:hypothetical protein
MSELEDDLAAARDAYVGLAVTEIEMSAGGAVGSAGRLSQTRQVNAAPSFGTDNLT